MIASDKRQATSDKRQVEIICPSCKSSMGTIGDMNDKCYECGFDVNFVEEVPVLWQGSDISGFDLLHEGATLPVLDVSRNIPIPFVKDAIASGGLVLELGAGVDVSDAINLVKTDAFVYSSEIDMAADAHNLPFADETFDYVFSLAVFEHLHSPWLAADEIFRILKPGGKVYTLTAFMQHVHGYPSHYFNMTDMGLRRIFDKFIDVYVEPSIYCPLDQIGYILIDVFEMNDNLKNLTPSKKSSDLADAIHGVCKNLSELSSLLIEHNQKAPAFSRIAPGFDGYATKPKR